jgi:hypothetical protein
MKRLAPLFLLVIFSLTSLACLAANRVLFGEPPTPTPIPATLVPTQPPTVTPLPSPTATPDSCPNGDCITACVNQLDGLPQVNGAGSDSKTMRRAVAVHHEYLLVTYAVKGDQISNPVDERGLSSNLKSYQQDRETQRRIWNYFAAIIPPEQRTFLTGFVVFTDGKENYLAAVSQSNRSPNEWVLNVDILDAFNPQDLTYTLVHEYGHLLTLNPSQVIPSQAIFDDPESDLVYEEEAAACQTYFPGEGCSQADSYVNQFFERFWPEIYPEWVEIDAIEDENDYYGALDDFYEKYQAQFVTDYAPTSPAEDIAESFTYFILRPKPIGQTVADQKVLFFYEFPELVQLRTQMGHRVCDQVGK